MYVNLLSILIRAISGIRKFLSLDTAKTLVHALVTSKVDHCNEVLYGLPKYKIERLQYVLNSAAMLVTLTHKYDHITPVLMELHWLPVEQRTEYKILLYTHKVVHGVAPDYLKELSESYRPGRNLRSANKLLLKTQSIFNLRELYLTKSSFYGTKVQICFLDF